MNKLFNFIIFLLISFSSFAVDKGLSDLRNLDPDTRFYLNSVQNGILGETIWKSYTASSLSTADYSGTNTYYMRVNLVDADNKDMLWLDQSVASFTVSTGGTTGDHLATLSSGTLSFVDGSATATLTLTGAFSIGSTVTLSFPLLNVGAISSTVGNRVLTFTE
jgi:hypothetical protein